MTKNNRKNNHKNDPKPASTAVEAGTSNISDDKGHHHFDDAKHWLDRNRVMSILTLFILATYVTGNVFSCRQLKITEKSIEIDERAWVGVDGIESGEPKDGLNTAYFTREKNTGKSPALKSRTVVEIDWLPTGQVPTFTYKGVTNDGSFGTLPPGGTHFAKSTIPVEVAHALQGGTMILWIHGYISYEDIFWRPHRTTFCLFGNGTGLMTFWKDHNEAD